MREIRTEWQRVFACYPLTFPSCRPWSSHVKWAPLFCLAGQESPTKDVQIRKHRIDSFVSVMWRSSDVGHFRESTEHPGTQCVKQENFMLSLYCYPKWFLLLIKQQHFVKQSILCGVQKRGWWVLMLFLFFTGHISRGQNLVKTKS